MAAQHAQAISTDGCSVILWVINVVLRGNCPLTVVIDWILLQRRQNLLGVEAHHIEIGRRWPIFARQGI